MAGRADLVDRAAARLTAPGIAEDVGSALDFNRLAFQGLFMAPLIVEQAMKGAIFVGAYLQRFLQFHKLSVAIIHKTNNIGINLLYKVNGLGNFGNTQRFPPAVSPRALNTHHFHIRRHRFGNPVKIKIVVTSDFHLNGSTGYGYGDTGRDILELIWADIFKAEKACHSM